ncbi:Eremophilane O-acetyltransferase prx11 [Penicillium rubens]|jgi:hypothetical protein|uniref:uncharacterized protein n=1 Tax=Penicillium rubens TaxID=1108849 RepID=UPI002A59B313|nr:uncharacterized protein N7525_001914 [Penicillium rubens]KAJ5034150.1 Eremophilane O-acetyltransferase prx11 [Penicillium rubens]KAJ5844173.1 hypothetical protein N7525_001914 [Penicillium rubens]
MYELQQHRRFSALDEMLPAFYYCYLLCFPVSSDNRAGTSELLQTSLSSLAEERPYLTGTVRRDMESSVRKGHLILDIPNPFEDLRIVFNDLRGPKSQWKETYQDLKDTGMPPHKLDANLLAPLTAGIGETRKVMSVQANFIHGGLLIAFCFHHNFVDAYGAGRIIARFSEHCNGTVDLKNSADPEGDGTGSRGIADLLDVELLKKQYKFEDLESDPNLWRLNCLEFRGVNDFRWPDFIPALLPVRKPPVISSMFSFSSDALAEIKAMVQPSQSGAWVSTNDALVAFLWRHTMRARFPSSITESEPPNRKSNVVVALDGRKDLSISPTYIGNCLFHCFTDLPINMVGSESTHLGDIAIRVRQTITAARNETLLKAVVGLAATHPDCQAIKYANDNLGPDLYVTSWIDLPFYKLEWGPLGKAEFFRIPDRQFESLCCILPPKDGVVQLITSMEEDHSKRLRSDAEFTRFATHR